MKNACFLCLLLLFSLPSQAQKNNSSVLITNVQVIDGSGSPRYQGALRIRGARIEAVGKKLRPKTGETVVDGQGMVLAPGFIDAHSHHDGGMAEKRDLPEVVSQGVSTIVVGQDGFSTYPISDLWRQLDSSPVAVNVASYTGHNTLRYKAMKNFTRQATAEEIKAMQEMLARELDAGALGLSTGLEYDPGIYSAREEVLQLAEILAQKKRRYISHIRSEDRFLWSAIEEIINIGRQHRIPVQVSHMKIAIVSQWGKADSLLQILNRAREEGIDISADVYPYEYWQSTMAVLFPERNFNDLEAARYALTELTTPEGMIIAAYGPDPSIAGKTLAQVAAERKRDPAELYLELTRTAMEQEADEGIICKSMDEEDIARLLSWSYTNICSDGGLNSRHPRGAGTFTRILRRYVREQQRFSLEEAVRKMTALPAGRLDIRERGLLKPGYFADLVLFDPVQVSDRASFQQPRALSEGIARLWVNGQEVWRENKTLGTYPGKVIKAPKSKSGK